MVLIKVTGDGTKLQTNIKHNNNNCVSPAEVFVHLVLIHHPCVPVHKELQKGKYGHESEGDQRHW